MRPAFCFPFALVLILLTTAAGTGGQPSPGEPSEDELPSGLKALHSDDPQVRYNAVCLLQKFGKTARFALPELYKMLNDPELPVRLKVVETLWQLEPKQADKLVPVLVEVLQQKDPVLRGRALAVLSQLGAKAKAALPAIKSALRDADFNVQLQAILAAAAIGPAAADVMPELLTILRTDDTGFLQGSVAIALSSMGPRVVPALRTAVQDKNERVRRGSAYALGLLGTKGYLAVPELTTALMDEDALVRVYAVQALGKMQRYAADAASAVQKLLHDADAEVRVQAALALWRIHEDAAGLAVLRRELSEAAEALVRQEAATALAEMGQAARAALPALRHALNDSSAAVRRASAAALGALAGRDADLKKVLTPLLKDEDPAVAIQTAASLWRVAHELSPAAVDVLTRGLTEEAAALRKQAVDTLGQIGPPAHSTLPALLPLLRDPAREVRQAAAAAIRVIAPERARQLRLP